MTAREDGVSKNCTERSDEKTAAPGEEGLWVFIFGDLILFYVFFATYMVARGRALQIFELSQDQLDGGLGLLNTLLLLTSSLFVAQAVAAVRSGGVRGRAFLVAAIVCGAAFLGVKVIEYGTKIAAGITLNTNIFFTYYYMLTAIHALHVTIGLGVLIFTLRRFGRDGRFVAPLGLIEGGGAFWHLVDLLWIFLFAILYLV